MESGNRVIDNNIPFLFASARHINVECNSHMHDNMEIIIVNEGILCMTVGGINYSVPRGHGVFVPPFAAHSFRSEEENECHVIMFSKSLVPYFYDLLGSHEPSRHIFAVSEPAYNLTEEILPNKNNTTDYICAQALLAPLCRDIYLQCEFKKTKVPLDDSLSTAMEYMETHFAEELELSRVAKAVGQHPTTLSKAFSKKAGVKFNFYLQYIRCYHAAELIKSGEVGITEAAYVSGFGSIRSFNRAFLNVYGVTPTQYKQGGSV